MVALAADEIICHPAGKSKIASDSLKSKNNPHPLKRVVFL